MNSVLATAIYVLGLHEDLWIALHVDFVFFLCTTMTIFNPLAMHDLPFEINDCGGFVAEWTKHQFPFCASLNSILVSLSVYNSSWT